MGGEISYRTVKEVCLDIEQRAEGSDKQAL